MTIHLYVDEDAMDRDLVQVLRARGVDVETALDAGMIERRNEDHLGKYPPAKPGALRLLAPQRGLIAIGQNQNGEPFVVRLS